MGALLRLTWLEIKIFVREPLGLVGSVGLPVLVYALLGRLASPRGATPASGAGGPLGADVPILASLLIVASAVLSLVAIIAIYREGGILRRLRATPLPALTILGAHVVVKLLFTAMTLGLMVLAGRRYFPIPPGVPLASFTLALLVCTMSMLSLGFVIASVVPTARFAQPLGTVLLYPMFGLCGLFVPVAALPPGLQAVARVLPMTYAVSLLRGIWRGDGWLAHASDLAALALIFAVLTAVAGRVFRWE